MNILKIKEDKFIITDYDLIDTINTVLTYRDLDKSQIERIKESNIIEINIRSKDILLSFRFDDNYLLHISIQSTFWTLLANLLTLSLF